MPFKRTAKGQLEYEVQQEVLKAYLNAGHQTRLAIVQGLVIRLTGKMNTRNLRRLLHTCKSGLVG